MTKIESCKVVKYGKASVRENNKCFIVKRIDRGEIYVVSVDGCVFNDSDEIKRCDYVIFALDMVYFIELKGKELDAGCKQIYETARIFKDRGVYNHKKPFAFLICGSYPKLFRAKEQIWKNKFCQLGIKLQVKNKLYKVEI